MSGLCVNRLPKLHSASCVGVFSGRSVRIILLASQDKTLVKMLEVHIYTTYLKKKSITMTITVLMDILARFYCCAGLLEDLGVVPPSSGYEYDCIFKRRESCAGQFNYCLASALTLLIP